MSKQRCKKLVAKAILICLISSMFASFFQTSFGKVKIKDIRIETSTGHMLSALLFIPPNATKDTPAPAIVTSHGWYNNREMQDMNYVEYARRGYVVLSIDMYGHGNSDPVLPSEWVNNGTGMYDAVKIVADLPYVDKTKIGITGHSNGARAANYTINNDNNAENQLVSAVLLVANDAMYSNNPAEPLYWSQRKSEDEYANMYKNRDVGIIAAEYDEFFFRSIIDENTHTNPRDFINTDYAQSFLHFGKDPKDFTDVREKNTIYHEDINGSDVTRVFYNLYQNHPWNTISSEAAKDGIAFFENSLGAPNPISGSNQIWYYKEFFNFLGLIGFVMFLINFSRLLLFTDTFQSLRSKEKILIRNTLNKSGKLWFFGSGIVISIIAGISFLKIYKIITSSPTPSFVNQVPVYYIGTWSVFIGIITLIVLILSYNFNSKKNGLNLKDAGLYISFKTFLTSIAFCATVVFASFALVFLSDYFFKTDYRFWVIAIKAFTPDKIFIALRYFPLFLIYYILNSISVNVFNYFKIGKKEWHNILILCIFNALAPLVLVVIQYISFFVTGEIFFTSVSAIVGIWLYPIIIILPMSAIISRKIYVLTNNPYIPGIINAAVVTLIMCSNTLTQLS